jgi:glucose/mannose-6-phosphate isomerase
MGEALDAAACAAVDSTGQLGEVLDLGLHLRDALWRFDSAAVAPLDAPGGLLVAGMGGSSVGGRLARAVLAPDLTRPLELALGYGIPPWTGPDTFVLCSSYSGSTEETLAAYDAATAAGAPRLAATTGGPLAERARADGVPVVPLPGGFQPRHAVGYSLITALEAAAACGAAPSVREDVEGAGRLAEALAAEWGPGAGADNEAKRLARALHGSFPVVTGAGLTAAVAYRWKCQVNENADLPAFASELPEHDHNEIVGWAGAERRLGAVFLEDTEADPRTALRMAVTAEIAAEGAAVVEHVRPRGTTRLERLVSLVLLGDVVSIYLAVLRGVDPVHIRAIDTLKARLAAA